MITIYTHFHCRKSHKPISCDMFLLGEPKPGELTPAEQTLFEEAGISFFQGNALFFYHHVLLSNVNRVVCAELLSCSSKRNNSCVMYCSGQDWFKKF